MKTVFDSQTDEALRDSDINKLTIPRVQTELLSRSLSTSYKVKKDLVDRLQKYLSSIVLE